MHINEQSPRTLRAEACAGTFRSHWFGSARRKVPLGNLGYRDLVLIFGGPRPLRRRRDDADRDSQHSRMPAHEPGCRTTHLLEVTEAPQAIACGRYSLVPVRLTAHLPVPVSSFQPSPVHLSYHWLEGVRTLIFDGLRTKLPLPIRPGQTLEYLSAYRHQRRLEVSAAPRPGAGRGRVVGGGRDRVPGDRDGGIDVVTTRLS